MAASWLIGLVFLAVLMAVVLVISNSDFCASVFETQTGRLKPVALWNGFRKLCRVSRHNANKIPLFYEVWSKVDGFLFHLFYTNHFNKSEMTNSHNKHFKTISFSRLYLVLNLLTTFIAFFFLLLTICTCIKSQSFAGEYKSLYHKKS